MHEDFIVPLEIQMTFCQQNQNRQFQRGRIPLEKNVAFNIKVQGGERALPAGEAAILAGAPIEAVVPLMTPFRPIGKKPPIPVELPSTPILTTCDGQCTVSFMRQRSLLLQNDLMT